MVSNMQTLTDLYNAKRMELGAHGRPLSHRDAAAKGGNPGMYETFRQIGNGQHSGRVQEDTVAALIQFGLQERDVRRAAGHQLDQSPGPFVLPDRAARLTLPQRDVVVSVMDAILAAAENREVPDGTAMTDQQEEAAIRAEGEATAAVDRAVTNGG